MKFELKNEEGLEIINLIDLGEGEDNDMTVYFDWLYAFESLQERAYELELVPPFIIKVSEVTQEFSKYYKIIEIRGFIYLIDKNNKTIKSRWITFERIYGEGNPRYYYIMKKLKKEDKS